MAPGKGTLQPPVIVWIRRNLRLADHPALAAAARSGRPLLPVFILPAATTGHPDRASRWWLQGSLSEFGASLRERGSRLILRSGDPAAILGELTRETGAQALFFNRSWQPDERRCEERVRASLGAALDIRDFPGDCLHEPGSVLSAAGEPLRVFTPFWRACLKRGDPALPIAAPRRWPTWSGALRSDDLEAWQLGPGTPDWAGGLRQCWQPGERFAAGALKRFVDSRFEGYGRNRDRVDFDGTSRLSAPLHFGEISPRQLWQAVRSRLADSPRLDADGEAFLRQIGWREFSLQLLHFWPDLPFREWQPGLAGFPWRRQRSALLRWQQGKTGYPLVDAGMRELWATGWMPNRIRMIVASFLVKHLLIDWRLGEAWFRDTLVDADEASNAASWQWIAGCGTDAAPWFRIFNPVLQGRKFDPEGRYVRKWLPELSALPPRFVHAPWTAPVAVVRAAGIRLGKDYPRPMVDHDRARQRALAVWRGLGRERHGARETARGRGR